MSVAARVDAWIAAHFGVVAAILTAWFVLAAWHLIPVGLVTPNGHLIDPSTTDPAGYNVYAYKHLAYSDIYRLYAERGLWSHPFPYFQARIEYPVLTGLFMWLAAFAHGANAYFITSAVGLWAAGLVTLFALRKLAPKRYHYFALTPLLFVFSLLNWDLLGIAFMVLGLWMARQERWTACGITLALGTCAKLFPVVYVPFLLAQLFWRDRAQMRRFLVVFLGVCVLVNLPFMIGGFHNWTFFLSFNASRGSASLTGSLIINELGNHVAAQDAVIGIAVAVAIALGIRSVRGGGSPERAAVLTFAIFLLLNKVYSPQYTLWLFVMGLIAQWPGWSLLLLTGTGLADYFGTFATLYVTNASVTPDQATIWWAGTVSPWVGRVRYLGVALSSLGGALTHPEDDEELPGLLAVEAGDLLAAARGR